MGNEFESNDLDRDVDASIRMFERSHVGPAATITPRIPSRVLLVLDGSPQDDSGIDSASSLQQRFNTRTFVLDARDKSSADETDLAISRASEVPDCRPVQRHSGDSYDAILAAIEDLSVDLLVIPCPFGRSFDKVGADSAGTVIDVLLSRCPIPMMVIRRDDQSLRQCVADVSMIVSDECDVELLAAAWVFGLAGQAAKVTLNLVVEKEQYENFRSILEALQPAASFDAEQFSDALTKTHQSIHGAMAKTAQQMGMTYHLRPLAGEIAPPNPLQQSDKMLLVLPLEVDDRFEQGFVQDRIRRSPHPVLIVPGHVPK